MTKPSDFRPYNNHSPLPWRECIGELEDANGKTIAITNYDQDYAFFPQDDLAFILHAVNTYYEREAALSLALDKIYQLAERYNDRSCDYDVCLAVRLLVQALKCEGRKE